MRVGILTHYDVNNLGAQLQMYALYHELSELGEQPVVLTYNKNYDFEYEQKLRNQIGLRSIPYIFREFVLKKGLRQTAHNTVKYLVNKKFRADNFQLSFYATTPVDAVVIGADEVYSIPVGVNTMMYGYGMLTKNIIAYAPSFGETDMALLKEHNVDTLIGNGLKQFVALSARDDHTLELTKELSGREPTMVCDPVILYHFDKLHSPIKAISKPYIAIYSYDRNMIDEREIAAIKEFAKGRGLLTVSVGNYHKWCDKNITCNCLEWLEYMRQADVVITDTFHGVVVSTILHKEIAVLKRSININKITALLSSLCMESRMMNELSLSELERVFSTKTDYPRVDAALSDMRKSSVEYLKNALEKCR